jgi:3-keto-disaccharide hydrolase
MSTCRIVLLLPFLITSSVAGAEPKLTEGFQNLFGGTDLKGWKVYSGDMAVWGADKGILYCDKKGGGWLLTEAEFADFELRFEFRWTTEGGNSGVGLRVPRKGTPHVDGMEIQLIDDENWAKVHKFDLKDTQHTGSLYGVKPPSKRVNKPIGEWNSVRIVCKKRDVVVEMNGTTINQVNLDDFKAAKGKDQPGILRDTGCIGFQSYNFRVEFKNIWLKPL